MKKHFYMALALNIITLLLTISATHFDTILFKNLWVLLNPLFILTVATNSANTIFDYILQYALPFLVSLAYLIITLFLLRRENNILKYSGVLMVFIYLLPFIVFISASILELFGYSVK